MTADTYKPQDYLFPPDGRDWAKILEPWLPSLPERFTVWMANLFGHVFIVLEDGTVHVLDIDFNRLEYLAENREAFKDMLWRDNNFSRLFYVPLVDRCIEAGLRLKPGECYTFLAPLELSGAFDVSNVRTAPLAEYYIFTASLHEQLKDVPPGGQVRIVVTE